MFSAISKAGAPRSKILAIRNTTAAFETRSGPSAPGRSKNLILNTISLRGGLSIPVSSRVRRLAITELDFEALNHAERKFYHDYLNQEAWTWKSSDLFFRDQGRLNYLAVKLNIPAFPLAPDLICRSGGSATVVSFDEVERGTCTFHVVHWTGVAPNPSFFCSMPLFRLYALVVALVGRSEGLEFAPGYEWLPERVGFSLWRHYYEKLFGPLRLRDRLTWSRRELKRLYRRSFKHITRSILGDRQTT